MSGQSSSCPTILVVDADEEVRALVSTTLADANYQVLEARGGLEGISTMLRYEGDIALAVVEIKMPGINGLDLANQIGVERPSTDVLYTSGLINSIAVESITRTKPEAVLAKPFTPEQLLARVRQCVSQKGSRPQGDTGQRESDSSLTKASLKKRISRSAERNQRQ